MKKILAIMLAVAMVFTLVSAVACNATKSVRVIVYATETSDPLGCMHVVGENDLPAVTNGALEFDGWFYDKAYTQPFDPNKEDNGQIVYAKWKQAGSSEQPTEKVVLTLDPDYDGAQKIVQEINKNSTYSLPNYTRAGYTFAGWFTERNGNGMPWTDSTIISASITLYAYWMKNNNDNLGLDDNPPTDLSAVLNKYSDSSSWNFADTVTTVYGGETSEDYYEYFGDLVLNRYEDTYGDTHTDYYDMSDSAVWYGYYDNGDGTYAKYDDTTDDFAEMYSYTAIIDLTTIGSYTFVTANGYFSVQNPGDAGKAVLGDYGDEFAWTALNIYISNGNITKIVGVMSDGTTYTHVFSKLGTVNFTLPNASAGGSGDDNPVTPDGVMEAQNYNANTFDKEVLQDKLTTAGKYPDPAIGLPSAGTYTALVIPVKFSNTTISAEQLSNLNTAFNGTSEQTGWESVKTYYNKASYGKLNLSFDIAGVNIPGVSYYTSSNKASYYEGLQAYDQDYKEWYNNGDNVLLHEVLEYYKDKLDLTKYDSNGDGAIDAVYLIYSAPVDYTDDSFYWAYVTWDDDNAAKKYDGLDVYYYLFAGLDFMNESVQGKNTNSKYPVISGLKINASTYIHETGHLLGLDDYYDYYPNEGCNEGLGGADMMDYTVGDQNVYSKTMLGWLTPEIVTTTKTITISSSQAQGDAILIPLNFNNSYFCEYLLIDLYSAQGLNQLHALMEDTYLYGGAAYGVRIYHVTSWITNAYDNDFGSFTDNNNSVSDIALIKLVEADGERKFAGSDGYAASDDLWQAGDSLNEVFPSYTRNDGKLLNFNITIDSVSSESATITITYITTEA